uniref:Uncharacterized protein n=1 Tax=Chromera velia CCMP2878 TaxID=1169474 RepID=A0A0G4FAN7_9ALVE|mmetsp:Transcript_44346/g.87575  ORF Transcript_44346/g.87575 Transcript_44346/m.87575 type:complete len:510 (-) Transcript_44346:57-1586(-)|eukprot:Cvel_15935.t1-p1 / transcript=Cvel_15935.t1 / gene=Cvel_15935 / organism=Chromera_velia_CCMP2878 / gene_product=hypothetical protein / transcript_product=hypothetical protein / location=Cvel_scaffold1205:31325-35539(-) / protein_length=509 / sequence_SO=supercontig / SO=protein_coding / is_pseudo=false
MTEVGLEDVPRVWEDDAPGGQLRSCYVAFIFSDVRIAKRFNVQLLDRPNNFEALNLSGLHNKVFVTPTLDLQFLVRHLSPRNPDVWLTSTDSGTRARIIDHIARGQHWITSFEELAQRFHPGGWEHPPWRPFDETSVIKPLLVGLLDRLRRVGQHSQWHLVPEEKRTVYMQKRSELLTELERLQRETSGSIPGLGRGMLVETDERMKDCFRDWWAFKIDALFLILGTKKALAELPPEEASTQADTVSVSSEAASEVEQPEARQNRQRRRNAPRRQANLRNRRRASQSPNPGGNTSSNSPPEAGADEKLKKQLQEERAKNVALQRKLKTLEGDLNKEKARVKKLETTAEQFSKESERQSELIDKLKGDAKTKKRVEEENSKLLREVQALKSSAAEKDEKPPLLNQTCSSSKGKHKRVQAELNSCAQKSSTVPKNSRNPGEPRMGAGGSAAARAPLEPLTAKSATREFDYSNAVAPPQRQKQLSRFSIAPSAGAPVGSNPLPTAQEVRGHF